LNVIQNNKNHLVIYERLRKWTETLSSYGKNLILFSCTDALGKLPIAMAIFVSVSYFDYRTISFHLGTSYSPIRYLQYNNYRKKSANTTICMTIPGRLERTSIWWQRNRSACPTYFVQLLTVYTRLSNNTIGVPIIIVKYYNMCV